MKSIEYCLDTILTKLSDSYKLQERPPLDSTTLMIDFEAPQGRDEFFKGLINILIDDGYVDFIDDAPIRKNVAIDFYRTRIIILPKGFYLLQQGGYSAISEMEKSRKKIQNLKDWLLIVGSWGAMFGAISLVCWEIYAFYHSS